MIKKTHPAPISAWRPINLDTFLMGAPHYPEHVPEDWWDRDAHRMKEAGFNAVRMGEFAWHLLEPVEGTFDFGLFDRAIEGLARHGIATIFCTPTATPPRWLTKRYPEVLRVDGNGRQASHGSRQHADHSSPVYRKHSQRITAALAQHYKDNPNVIGWQTDNELNTSGSRFYSASTEREFQLFLAEKYGDVGSLNRAWGGDFWATAYSAFEDVVLPLDFAPGFCGPGHLLDYHRFLAFATARFQHDQVEILRRTNADWFIFHNLGALEDIDFRGQFSSDLDFAGYDIYPFLYDEMQRNGGAAQAQAFHLDVCRGFSGNFIVPEQQSGFGSQPAFTTLTPEPGEMRRMAYSSVSRGADGLMFFRWRPAHFGAEIYWMGLIDHDDVPRRRYAEAQQFFGEMKRLAPSILGTSVRMDVAIAGGDFDNQEAHRAYPIGLPSPHDESVMLHRALYRRNYACGFIHPEDDLTPLKAIYVPHWVIWDDRWTKRLETFAENGGTVIISARTGSRDIDNQVIRDAAPGKSLSSLAGVTVEEFGRLASADQDGLFAVGQPSFGRQRFPAESADRPFDIRVGNKTVRAAHLYELLDVHSGTELLATWASRFTEGRGAITSRTVGQGRVIYLGTYLTEELIVDMLLPAFEKAGALPLAALPTGVEISVREGADHKLYFIANTNAHAANGLSIPPGEVVVGSNFVANGFCEELPAFECLVIRIAD